MNKDYEKRFASDRDLPGIVKKINADREKNDKPLIPSRGRRFEMALIGCQLFCLRISDIFYILDDTKSDIIDAERLFRKRKFA